NRIYVADRNNDRIVRTDDMNATHWMALGTHGKAEKQFSYPLGIYVDSNEKIYVTDSINVVTAQLNNRIVRTDDMQGANWRTLGDQQATGSTQFNTPSCIVMDGKGRIYVA